MGESPLGFPVNVKIQKPPPVLFTIKCHDYDVAFSDFIPRLCITTAKDYCYKVIWVSFVEVLLKNSAHSITYVLYVYYIIIGIQC